MEHTWNRRQFLNISAGLALQERSVAVSGQLRAGAATANITPALGCSLAGGMTDRRATEVDDELHIRALALDNSAARIGIAVVDSCAVPRSVIDGAKEIVRDRAGVPARAACSSRPPTPIRCLQRCICSRAHPTASTR